jgi:formate hydrogenlyase subunit 3/multisubunit Na+/H+ antiporter MnhD subunit
MAWAVGLSLVALASAFAGLTTLGRRLLLASRPGQATSLHTPLLVMAPLVVGLSLCAAIGVFAWPFDAILHAASTLVTS